MSREKLKVVEMPAAAMTLLPPRPGLCQVCAVDHDPRLPHNKDSLYYQVKFKMEHGRSPTWDDALAHCTDEVKEAWYEAMEECLKKQQGEVAE